MQLITSLEGRTFCQEAFMGNFDANATGTTVTLRRLRTVCGRAQAYGDNDEARAGQASSAASTPTSRTAMPRGRTPPGSSKFVREGCITQVHRKGGT